jgi:hypothetical protein
LAAGRRARLKAIARDKDKPMEDRFAAALKLAELPRNPVAHGAFPGRNESARFRRLVDRGLSKLSSKTGRLAATKASPKGTPYEVATVMKDGVKILRPKTKPKHFTSTEIRRTISEVEARSHKA